MLTTAKDTSSLSFSSTKQDHDNWTFSFGFRVILLPNDKLDTSPKRIDWKEKRIHNNSKVITRITIKKSWGLHFLHTPRCLQILSVVDRPDASLLGGGRFCSNCHWWNQNYAFEANCVSPYSRFIYSYSAWRYRYAQFKGIRFWDWLDCFLWCPASSCPAEVWVNRLHLFGRQSCSWHWALAEQWSWESSTIRWRLDFSWEE